MFGVAANGKFSTRPDNSNANFAGPPFSEILINNCEFLDRVSKKISSPFDIKFGVTSIMASLLPSG